MKTFVCREMVSVVMFAFIVFTLVVANIDQQKTIEKYEGEKTETVK